MIRALAFDGGTSLRVQEEAAKGLDQAWWTQVHLEEMVGEETTYLDRYRDSTISTSLRAIRRWPTPITNHMPIDLTPRYAWTGNDGLALNLLGLDPVTGGWYPHPKGSGAMSVEPRPEVYPARESQGRLLTLAETQADVGPDAIRLRYRNELGGTALEQPWAISWEGVEDVGWLSSPDNSLFIPFDLSNRDLYAARDINGSRLDWSFAALKPGATYHLHLGPRRWRYTATLLAHFYKVTWFEMVPWDVWFIRSWYDRAPVYPYRHDVIRTAGNEDWWDTYLGIYLAYDAGLESAFLASDAADYMRGEIEFTTGMDGLCSATILASTEAAALYVWREAARRWDVPVVIQEMDQGTGVRSEVYVEATGDTSSLYPRQLLGTFYGGYVM